MNAEWKYDVAADLDQPLVDRLRRFPREPDMLVYGLRCVAAGAVRSWLKAVHRFQILGLENLPREGSFVMVANHSSHLDALCLLAALPFKKLHRAFPAAAQDYFFKSLPRTWVAAVAVNAFPFSRQTHIRQSMAVCHELLENPGNILILFPEGTRTTTGELGRFKPGIGILLAGSRIPAVPCHLHGAFQAWPKGNRLPRPSRITLSIGPAVNYESTLPGREAAEAIARDLEDRVKQLAAPVPSQRT